MKKYLFIINYSFILNIIILPFQTYNPLIIKNQSMIELIRNTSDKDIVNTILRNLMYVNLDVGENRQKIQTFIEMNARDIFIKDLSIHTNSPSLSFNIYKIKNFNFTYNDNYLLKNIFSLNYYNSSLSKTYKYIDKSYEFISNMFSKQNLCGNETLYLIQKNSIEDKEINIPITFYITFKEMEKYDHRPGVIGLQMGNNQFISNLKKSSEINGYDWSIKYTNLTEEKGEIIIGDLPHIYDKNNYKENNLRFTKIIKETFAQYSLNFDIHIKYKNKTEYFLGLNEISSFFIEEFFISGTYEYLKFIEHNFFQDYIYEKICKKQIHPKGNYDDFFHFICYITDNKKREDFFNNFPSLIFYQKDMNYNFTLDGKDLFTIFPDNKRILFNIDFSYNSKRWVLGKPFFKKYQLIFNYEKNLISYYIEQNSDIKENNKENNNLKIIIIIFLAIFAFFIGIIFGRVLCSKYNRKIRANELEDNYSYISNNKNNNKDVKEINLRNENFNSKYYNLNN